MKKVYIAAPIFNKAQLEVVSSISLMLKLLEFEYFSPYEASKEIWKGRAPKDCSPEERRNVLEGNINYLHWSDILLCWVGGKEDGRVDTGVAWEMGYFNALSDWRKQATHHSAFTLAYVDPTDKLGIMNLMLSGTVDAVAYGPAQLHAACEALRETSEIARVDKREKIMQGVRERFNPEISLRQEDVTVS